MFVRRAVSEQLKQIDRHTQRIALCTIVALTNLDPLIETQFIRA